MTTFALYRNLSAGFFGVGEQGRGGVVLSLLDSGVQLRISEGLGNLAVTAGDF